MNFSVTQFGKSLSKGKYTWDTKTKTFSTEENNLVLDFTGISGITFKTGHNCTFKTGNCCIFNTGSGCIFNTCDDCIFNTGSNCTFDTGHSCTFNTDVYCIVIRRDTFEIIIPKNTRIKLNAYGVSGYIEIKSTKIITVDGKDIEISAESFEAFKNQFLK